MPKHLSILGSTGSIGRNLLAVVEQFPDQLHVSALAAKDNIRLLAQQIQRFHPQVAVVYDAANARALQASLPNEHPVRILYGEKAYQEAATLPEVDTVVTAVVGAAGLLPTLTAIDAGKNIALANKETLVMAGRLVMQRAAENGIQILPIDSEHSAIFQCLQGQQREDLDRIYLTASGGPFRKVPKEKLATMAPADALNHPTWDMGNKISIDSATLMNKGLEVIEAHWLFDAPLDMIEVVVHPQSIIHSMVAFRDGSVIAQMGIPDMKGAIAYALSYPGRLPLNQPLPAFTDLRSLTFEPPDMDRFPCLSLAFQAGKTGHTLPAVMNAANEIAVEAFLNHHIPFLEIPQVIKAVMDGHQVIENPTLTDILDADRAARDAAQAMVNANNT
jgi:1-deoxy-D-xylulose-5-phosphate reductoisomerase